MKRTLIVAAVGVLMALGVGQSQAQVTNTNITVTGTQVVQTVQITMTAFFETTAQNGSTTISRTTLNNRSVLQELSTVLGTNVTSGTLVAITPLGSSSTNTNTSVISFTTPVAFQVRKGSTIIADVTSFFTVTQLGTPLVATKSNGQVTAVDSLVGVTFTGAPDVSFDTTGLATSTVQTVVQRGGGSFPVGQLRATVSGSGTISVGGTSTPALFQGTINLNGRTIETVTVTGP